MIDYLASGLDIGGEITENRHYLHMHPELGNHEFLTASFIEEKLKSYGLEVERLLDTAVVGTLDTGLEGPTAALRSDIDALPVIEATGCDFSSLHEGRMHACGHDVHMSSALGAARLLSMNKSSLRGKVKFIFQPDEEGDGGAERLVALGVMDDVDAVFGAHVAPDIELGSVGIRYGKFYAAADDFRVMVQGRSAHAAQPEKGADALLAAAHMVTFFKELTKEVLPDKAVLTTGIFNAGRADNVIAEEALFRGILRTLGPFNREYMHSRMRETAQEIADRYGVTAEVVIKGSYSGVVNSDDMTLLAEEAFSELLGKEHVVRISEPYMLTEDFGYYIEAKKGCFYHLGAGSSYPLHSPLFLPSEKAPIYGAALHAQVLSRFLMSD